MPLAKRYPWVIQPPAGTPVDWSNSVTKSLLVAVLPGQSLGNAVDRANLSWSFTPAAAVVNQAGPAAVATTSSVLTWTPPSLTEATVLTVTRNRATSVSNCPWAISTTGDHDFVAYSSNTCYFGGFSGARFVTSVAPPNGGSSLLTPFVVAVKGKSGDHSAWVQGIKLGSSSSSTFSPMSQFSFGAESGGYGTATETSLILVWGRALSDREMSLVCSNPWQIYQP